MENAIVGTLSAITITISSIISPTPPPAPITPVAQEELSSPFKIYVVEKGDSLGSIAKEHFGATDYWTTLWNDNPDIGNPSLIEKDAKINIAKENPREVEELEKELVVKQEEIRKKQWAMKVVLPSPSSKAGVPSLPPVVSSPASLNEEQLNFLGNCESGMTAARNSGNGYFGAFQFSIGTWNSMGTGYERADLAPIEIQKDAVQRLLARSSIFTQFPGCAARMKSIGLL